MLIIKLECKKTNCIGKIVDRCINAPRALVIRCRRELAKRHYVPYTGVMSSAYTGKRVFKDEADGRVEA